MREVDYCSLAEAQRGAVLVYVRQSFAPDLVTMRLRGCGPATSAVNEAQPHQPAMKEPISLLEICLDRESTPHEATESSSIHSSSSTDSSSIDDGVLLQEQVEALVIRHVQQLINVQQLIKASISSLGANTPLVAYGVDSTSAMELATRIAVLVGFPVSPTIVFDHPTPKAIAAHLLEQIASDGSELARSRSDACSPSDMPSVDTVAGVPLDARLPTSSMQHQLLLHRELHTESTAYDLCLAITVHAQLAEATVRAALQSLVSRHAVLRTFYALDAHAATYFQVVLPADGYSVPLTSCFTPSAWRDVLTRELRVPLDPFAAPPLRAVLLLQGSSSRLLLNVHHVASDMDTLAIIRAELSAHCAALACDRSPPMLPPLAVEYADFALWAAHARGDELDQESALSWWLSELRGAPAMMDLPLDHARPEMQVTAHCYVGMHLERSLTMRLATRGASAGATLSSTLLAAWSMLMHRLTGQTAVVIGLPHSMR